MNRRFSSGIFVLLIALFIATYAIPAYKQKVLNNNPSDFKSAVFFDSMMQVQANAWNKGDLDGFMELYNDADSMLFITKRKTTFGKKALYDSYSQSYWKNAQDRGVLNFEIHNSIPLDYQGMVYLVHGKWGLQLSDTAQEGKFSLVFKCMDKKVDWKIIADHTW